MMQVVDLGGILMIKTIFFDFDGVITIDAKGSLSFANYIVSQTGIDKTLFLEKYREFGPALLTGQVNHLDIWADLNRALNTSLPTALIEAAFIATPINQEIISLIEELKASGYKIGLITDNKADRMKTLFDYHQWHDLFDVLGISAHVGSRKNQPEIYHYVLEVAETRPEEAIFIDNTLKNLVIPREIGFQTIFFDNKDQDVPLLRAELQRNCDESL